MQKVYYKVVTQNRESCVVGQMVENLNKKYKLKYPLGQIVRAIKGSLGIFCFENLKEAERFTHAVTMWKGFLIIQVEGIGNINKPNSILSGFGNEDDYCRGYRNNEFPSGAPVGTICFPSVKVLN